jgi:hypothetical protein
LGILLDTFKKQLQAPASYNTTRAKKWLYDKISNVRVNRQVLLKNAPSTAGMTFIGNMFFFVYDPKLKKKLPYYDRFPLVFPIEMYEDGFLGLNLHYLEPGFRVMLLDRLSEYKNNKKYDHTTRLKLSYELINSASKLEMARPCIKRYLFNHVESVFVPIESSEWIMACFLPAENFKKATKYKVWEDSRNMF